MRILLIHQFFLADGEAGGSRFNDITRVWANDGHHVTVIADSTHYQSGDAEQRPEIFLEGIEVIRVKTLSYRGHQRAARVRSYGQFAVAASNIIRRLEPHDIVIASSPSLPVAIPGIVAKRHWNIPFVFEVRDLWPESAISTGVIHASSLLARAGYLLEEKAYEKADHIVALSPGIQHTIEPKLGNSVTLIPNGVHAKIIKREEKISRAERLRKRTRLREKFGWEDDEFIIVYLGAHGIANSLDVLIEAATILKNDTKFRFACVGDGPLKDKWIEETKRRKLKNMEWLDPIAKEATFDLLRAANAGVAVLQRNETFTKVYPNKIFDYMSVGIPTICAIGGDARELIETYDAGIYVQPEHALGIANAARELASSKKSYNHTKEAILLNFDREELGNSYLNLLKRLVNASDQ